MNYLIGIGNYMQGDDGIGPRLVEAVCQRGLDTTFEALVLAANGIDLLTHFVPQTGRMLIVDCARMGLAPGQHRLLAPAAATPVQPATTLSTHDNDLLALIEYARAAGCPIPPLNILAIQPQAITFGAALSPPLCLHFEHYLQVALREMNRPPTPCPRSRRSS